MTATTHPWSVTVRVDAVPESGRHVAIEADAATRAAVAKAANVNGIDALSATFDVTRRGRDGLRAVGTVRASVRQTCVVSLEPMTSAVEEEIDVTFAQPRDAAGGRKIIKDDDENAPVAGSIAGEEPPEPLVGGAVDLGALATEFLILGIDPYPRREDAAFAPPAQPQEASGNPFEALTALKKASKVKE